MATTAKGTGSGDDQAARTAFRVAVANHPELADFEPRWMNTLPELRRAEAERARWKMIGIGTIVASILTGAILIGFVNLGHLVGVDGNALGYGDALEAPLSIIAVVIVFGGAVIGLHLKDKPAKTATDTVRQALFHQFDVQFDETALSFPFSRFAAAQILPAHGRRKLSDHVKRRSENGGFEACEAELSVYVSAGPSSTAPRSRVVFKGLLVLWPSRTRAEGRTIVVRDSGAIGSFFSALGGTGNRFDTGDAAFERMFEVYTTSTEAAGRLVSAPFRDNLLWHRENFGGQPTIGFLEDGSVVLAMQDGRNRFGIETRAGRFTDPEFVLSIAIEITRFLRMINDMEICLRGEIPDRH